MTTNAIRCSLIVMGTVALFIALGSRQIRSADPQDFRLDVAKLKDTTRWTRVNTKPYYISAAVDALCRIPTREDYEAERRRNPHAATYITVYVNGLGRKAMLSNEPRRFPEGSVIVKEKVGMTPAGSKPLLYTLMIKREPGYNPAVGDWEFLVASGDDTRIEARGKLENCQSCHIRKRDSDFVFRSYLNLK